jgi:hypothetical protein
VAYLIDAVWAQQPYDSLLVMVAVDVSHGCDVHDSLRHHDDDYWGYEHDEVIQLMTLYYSRVDEILVLVFVSLLIDVGEVRYHVADSLMVH